MLTHLGLEPVRELGPEPVKLQAHFSVHADAHVVVHHLCLHLHTTGMSAVEQENEQRERHRPQHTGRAQFRSTSCASGAAKYLSDELSARVGVLMKGAFPICPYCPLIFSAWAGAVPKPMARVLSSAPAHCQQHRALCKGKRKKELAWSPSGRSRVTRLLMRCLALPGCSPAGRLFWMRTSHLSSSETAACSTSRSVAGRPRSRSMYRPPPQFRQRARSLPARHIRLYLGCNEHLAVLLLPALGYLG